MVGEEKDKKERGKEGERGKGRQERGRKGKRGRGKRNRKKNFSANKGTKTMGGIFLGIFCFCAVFKFFHPIIPTNSSFQFLIIKAFKFVILNNKKTKTKTLLKLLSPLSPLLKYNYPHSKQSEHSLFFFVKCLE